jgi:hypothetical protein
LHSTLVRIRYHRRRGVDGIVVSCCRRQRISVSRSAARDGSCSKDKSRKAAASSGRLTPTARLRPRPMSALSSFTNLSTSWIWGASSAGASRPGGKGRSFTDRMRGVRKGNRRTAASRMADGVKLRPTEGRRAGKKTAMASP